MYKNILNNKDDVIKKIKEKCKEEKIDVIITLAKKGDFLFNKLNNGEDTLELEHKTIPVFCDRTIFKKEDLSLFNGRNILLFDDSMRSGNHFKNTKTYLEERVEDIALFYYCIIICKDQNRNIDFEVDSYYGNENIAYKEYYKFCLDEAYNFQKEMLGNSVDLPVFDGEVDDIDNLKYILANGIEEVEYYESKRFIGLNKINIGTIIIQLPSFMRLFNGFIKALTCRLRYELNNGKSEKKYKVKLTGFAITNSIKYSELKEMYNKLFDETVLEEKDMDETLKIPNNLYIKYYRYINYLISYWTGEYLKNKLAKYNYDFKYHRNTVKFFNYTYDYFISNLFSDYKYNLEKRLDNFQYTKYYDNIDENDEIEYTYDQLNEILFKQVLNCRQLNREKNQQKNYQSVIIENITKLFGNNPNNLRNFCCVLINNIECYLISNEIVLNKEQDENWIIRGFMPGETSMTTLLYDAREFFAGMNCFYERVKDDFNLYKENYDIFMNYYIGDIYSVEEEFFYWYFKNISKENFQEYFESKQYLLDDDETIAKQHKQEKWAKVLLASSKFTFNRKEYILNQIKNMRES